MQEEKQFGKKKVLVLFFLGETKWFCENIFLVNFVIFWYKKNCEEKKLFVTKKNFESKISFFFKRTKKFGKKNLTNSYWWFFFLVKKVGS